MSQRALFLFVFLLTLAVYLAACRSEPVQEPAPVELPAEVVLDFEGLPRGEDGLGLADVLRVVSDASAWNFTYTESTGLGLEATRVDLEGRRRVRRSALEAFLEELLAAQGFELRPVGPAELRTWLVEPGAGGPRTAALEILTLENVAASEAAETCRGIAAEAPVTIVPDPRTNSLLVYASARDLARIQTLVAEIEAAAARARR